MENKNIIENEENEENSIENEENSIENEENEENEEIKNKEKDHIEFSTKTKSGKFKVDCWHNEKNGDLTPRDVSKKSRKLCWFLCDICGHDFQRTIKHIVINNRWCPYCYEHMVCDNDDCEVCYNNSFASFGE
jgi:hypothetical protein